MHSWILLFAVGLLILHGIFDHLAQRPSNQDSIADCLKEFVHNALAEEIRWCT